MRRATTMGGIALATAAFAWWFAGEPAAGPEDLPAVLEPAPEVPDAEARGAADVARAQKLARAKKYTEAVAILEPVAAALPSTSHDCNLALAYLRAGELTRAQLRWDLARLRGTKPPAWCTSVLAADLAAALRDRGYVPLALSVTPSDAIVEVAGLHLRKLDLLWVAPGMYTIVARAPGLVDGEAHVAVAAPSARVAITLAPPVVEVAPPVDAAVPIDAPPPEVDAPVAAVVPPPVVEAPSRPMWPAYLWGGLGAAALAAGVSMHVRASDTRDAANHEVRGTPAFGRLREDFDRQRTLAVAGYVVAAAGLGFAGWWWLRGDGHAADRPAVGLTVGGDGAAVTFGWSTP